MPFVFISLVASRNPNNLNNFPKSSFLIPVPVSITYTSNIPCYASLTNYFKFYLSKVRSLSSFIYVVITFTEPLLPVNFNAFETKFNKIY